MSQEKIVARMSRSDLSIPWSFSVRSQGGQIVIDRVDKNGLAEKAGLLPGDAVQELLGKRVGSVAEAEAALQKNLYDIDIALQRYVTSRPCIPWTLNEKDNKVIVDYTDGRPSHYQSSPSNRTTVASAASESEWKSPFAKDFFTSDKFKSSQYNDSRTSTFERDASRSSGSAPFQTSSGNFSNLRTSHGFPSNVREKRVERSSAAVLPQSHSNYNNQKNDIAGSHFWRSQETGRRYEGDLGRAPSDVSAYSRRQREVSPRRNPSNQASLPYTQQTFIHTGNAGLSPSQPRSPGKVIYQSPRSRNRNDLSPGASVHHLQYNSPMNLYSSQAVAEQLEAQTGLHPANAVPAAATAYLNSETRKLIEEEESGRERGRSPSQQSSSFKRIAQACGAQ